MQALPALPESLCIVQMGEVGDSEVGVTSVGGFFLNIGLQNGVLLRTALDGVTGDLADTRTRYVIITVSLSLIIVFLDILELVQSNYLEFVCKMQKLLLLFLVGLG